MQFLFNLTLKAHPRMGQRPMATTLRAKRRQKRNRMRSSPPRERRFAHPKNRSGAIIACRWQIRSTQLCQLSAPLRISISTRRK